MLDARASGQLGEPLALLLLALDAGLPRVLHREHSPGPGQRLLQGGGVVEVSPNDLGALGRERPRRLAVRLARQRADFMAACPQCARHGAALMAGRTRHQYRSHLHDVLLARPSAIRGRPV